MSVLSSQDHAAQKVPTEKKNEDLVGNTGKAEHNIKI